MLFRFVVQFAYELDEFVKLQLNLIFFLQMNFFIVRAILAVFQIQIAVLVLCVSTFTLFIFMTCSQAMVLAQRRDWRRADWETLADVAVDLPSLVVFGRPSTSMRQQLQLQRVQEAL